MAKLSRGLFGLFGDVSGSIGPFVFYRRNGINCVRKKSTQHNDNPTETQLAQRLKFSVVAKFIKAMHSLLMISIKEKVGKSGSNIAFGYAIQNAVIGKYPDLKLDYSRALISRGRLPNAENPTTSARIHGAIKFKWHNNSGLGSAGSDDEAILVTYCEELNQSIYKTEGAFRNKCTDSLMIPQFSGKKVETWIAFSSAKDKSNSIYTGCVNVR